MVVEVTSTSIDATLRSVEIRAMLPIGTVPCIRGCESSPIQLIRSASRPAAVDQAQNTTVGYYDELC